MFKKFKMKKDACKHLTNILLILVLVSIVLSTGMSV